MRTQPASSGIRVGIVPADEVPELAAMMELEQVAELVNHDVRLDLRSRQHCTPGNQDAANRGAGAEPSASGTDRHRLRAHADPVGVVGDQGLDADHCLAPIEADYSGRAGLDRRRANVKPIRGTQDPSAGCDGERDRQRDAVEPGQTRLAESDGRALPVGPQGELTFDPGSLGLDEARGAAKRGAGGHDESDAESRIGDEPDAAGAA